MAEQRLIDANALIDWLTRATGFRTNCDDCTDIDCLDCIIEEAIKNAPTVKAKPVVHAHWDYIGSSVNSFIAVDRCSNGGVDNWEWCGESCCDFLKEEGVEDFDELVDKEIMNYEEYKGE